MKKSILSILILEILLIVLVFSSTKTTKIKENTSVQTLVQKELKENENASMNYLLKYPTIDGYEPVMELYGEAAIQTSNKEAMFSIDTINTKDIDIETFFKEQEEIFSSFGNYELVSENTSTLNDRTIQKKIYHINADLYELYAMIGIVEIKGVNDKVIAVVGNVQSLDYEKDFDTLLNSTNYTKISIDETRLFDSELENFTMSVLPNWKRLEKVIPFSFYKEDENSTTFLIANSANKADTEPMEAFKNVTEAMLSEQTASLVEDSKVETIKDKTITTSIIKYSDAPITTLISLVEFKDANTFVLVRSDISIKVNPSDIQTEEDLNNVLNSSENEKITNNLMTELDTIIKSINLKEISEQTEASSETTTNSEE